MSEAIIVAIFGFSGTLLGSLFGILSANKLMSHRVSQLEKQTERHGDDIKAVEGRTAKLEGEMIEVQHDIRDLKEYHKPK